MRWATSVRHQTSIAVNGKIYNILCDGAKDEDLALCVNGEYICDVQTLPDRDELIGFIEENIRLNRLARTSFSGMGQFND